MMKPSREAELKRYRTYVWSNGIRHPTFDMERFYSEMSTEEMIALRDKTVRDLERSPNFATSFIPGLVDNPNGKLAKGGPFGDWIGGKTPKKGSW